jgi:serine protease Do
MGIAWITGAKAPSLRNCIAALLCALSFAAPTAPAHAAATSVDWSDIVQHTIPCVVNIAIETIATKDGVEQRRRDVGSGFVIDPSGIIATNKHVIAGAFRIIVTMSDRSQWNARVIAAATMIDLAVLKIDVGHPLPYLRFADSDKAHVGEAVILIGNPLGLGTSVSSGIISAVHRDLMNSPVDDYIQTDAALNHGNSGGPMLDRDGNVLGVSTILVTAREGDSSSGLGFAISSNAADYTIRHLLHPEIETVGWIGVHVQDVSPPLQSAFHLPSPDGFVVTKTDDGSPAAAAGLGFGDVITRYGNATPSDARDLMRRIIMTPINTTVPVTFEREGRTMITNVTVTDWKGMRASEAEVTKSMASVAGVQAPDFGIILAPMSDTARRFYKLSTTSGVVVAAVDPTSEATSDGVRAGDVILAVGDHRVTSPEQAMQAIAQAKASHKFVALLVSGKDGDPWWVALYSGQATVSEASRKF